MAPASLTPSASETLRCGSLEWRRHMDFHPGTMGNTFDAVTLLPKRTAGPSQSPQKWKGTSTSKPPCLGSMFVFGGINHCMTNIVARVASPKHSILKSILKIGGSWFVVLSPTTTEHIERFGEVSPSNHWPFGMIIQATIQDGHPMGLFASEIQLSLSSLSLLRV